MLVKDLREQAKNLGISNYNKMKKNELIEAIATAQESISKASNQDVDNYDIILESKDVKLKYCIEAESKQEAVNELHKLLRLPNHSHYRQLSILKDGKLILNITR